MPKVRCHTLKTKNNYLVPPAPHCIDRDAYLPLNNMKFSDWVYQLKQPKKTLPYEEALQHWVEKA